MLQERAWKFFAAAFKPGFVTDCLRQKRICLHHTVWHCNQLLYAAWTILLIDFNFREYHEVFQLLAILFQLHGLNSVSQGSESHWLWLARSRSATLQLTSFRHTPWQVLVPHYHTILSVDGSRFSHAPWLLLPWAEDKVENAADHHDNALHPKYVPPCVNRNLSNKTTCVRQRFTMLSQQ